ncbi:MAG: acyl--CoA ligase [Desulfobacteraceae bacterium]|nr:acyl--CoA ligase [Desulfobacteraceae bacterium]
MIHHFLENSAARFPKKTAVIHDDNQATFFQVNTWADNLAAYLQENNICKGDRVMLLMENSIDYIVAYYGILKTGAIAAPVSLGLKPDGLQYLIDDLEPTAIITTYKSERLLKAVTLNEQHLKLLIIKNPKQKWDTTTVCVSTFEQAVSDQANTFNLDNFNKDDLASIIYTSGSTGKPKGVMLTHDNIVSNTLSICEFLDLTQDDRQMVVLPLFYVMGKSLLNTHFAVGGSVVLNNKFLYPADVIKQMAKEKVTGFSGVPSTYAYLLHRSPLLKYRDKLPALRYCSQAGGHMVTQLKKDLRSTLPNHTDIVIMYGATEASARLSYLEPSQFEHRLGSIGKAIAGVQLDIIGDNGKSIENGSTGELVAKGSNIMQGYWKNPEATYKALDSKSCYHTGDIAYKDNDGYFYLTGRKDNVLKVSGHKVNPQDIEECLMQTRQLVETAVIGIPDKLTGYRLVAICVARDNNFKEMELKKYCNQMLLKHQVPNDFLFLKNLPKGSSGKVNRQQCITTYNKLKA